MSTASTTTARSQCIKESNTSDSGDPFLAFRPTWAWLVAMFHPLDELQQIHADEKTDRQKAHEHDHHSHVVGSFCLRSLRSWSNRSIVCSQQTCDQHRSTARTSHHDVVTHLAITILLVGLTEEYTKNISKPIIIGQRIADDIYLRQGGYVFVVVVCRLCLFISNFAQKLPNGFA